MNIINMVTLRGLKKNKIRTIVTIIGIILSAAMITGVTALISSMQNYMVNIAVADEGNWYAAVHNVSYEDYLKLKNMDGVTSAVIRRDVGYSALDGSINEYKPYLYLAELSSEAFEVLPIHLTKGRLPEKEDEILISEHIRTSGGVDLKIGSTLNLQLGTRVTDDGISLDQSNPYIIDDNSEEKTTEKLEIKCRRTFTIVGEMNRMPFSMESYTAPGYTIFSLKDFNALPSAQKASDKDLSVYFTTKSHRKIYDTVNEISKALGVDLSQFEYNNELLRYKGVSKNDSFNAVLYSLGAILTGLIMIGSISLIYNSFSISVSERTKQFGLLSSAGATAKQLKNSVFFDAVVLAVIGIPLGVLSGIFGIYVTLYYVGNLFEYLISTAVKVPLTLSVSPLSVLSAVLIAFITIMISAYIPARRSGKMSAVEAIRQTSDIKLKEKQVRTLGITRKLFGLEGDLALKNIKRNSRRYRSTVISLFLSIVLFISASALATYLTESVKNIYQDDDFDLYHFSSVNHNTDEKESFDYAMNVYEDILALDTVNQGSFITTLINYEIGLSREEINESYFKDMLLRGYKDDEDKQYFVQVNVKSIDHETFNNYIKTLGLNEDLFSGPEQVTGILIDKQHYYDYKAQKYKNTYIFKDRNIKSLTLEYNHGEEPMQTEVKLAAVADTAPFGLRDYADIPGTVMFIIDENSRHNLMKGGQNLIITHNMYFAADDPFEAEADIKEVLTDAGLSASSLVNRAQILRDNRNIITIISVFAYGFMVLISLITIANVFNTISTNVNLRRREFAMLKSVGMTDKSFNKMLNFECIFYGLKALLYGLPVSIFITYLIYRSIVQGFEMSFRLPAKGVLISIFSVFVVVFVSMMYSMRKIRNENILDALKSEIS
ncbi:MAG: ABC transporter permease [Clostridiales bacterium]|nr:ABC transporter permease [Clostridiales bacterium]